MAGITPTSIAMQPSPGARRARRSDMFESDGGQVRAPVPGRRRWAPFFDTQHEARDFLAEYQARGFIRLCAHARVRGTDPTGWDNSYAVVCDENSFAADSTAAPGVADFYRL